MNNFNHPSGIQIIGTQRSGSNLLRLILDQSAEITSPHPAHVPVTFMPLLKFYGKLNRENYKLLINDVVNYVEANPVPWENVKIDREKILADSRIYSLFEINRLIYEQAAISKNAKYWCCKSMANVHYAAELESHSPNLKYIYLYRDGRDVALSFKKAIVGEKHIYSLAKQWKHDQDACLKLAAHTDESRFFALNYEKLIVSPEKTIRNLCAFLDISYSEKMPDFYRSNGSRATAAAGEMWQNLSKPIMSNNKGKFHAELSHDELETFELVAHDVLKKLGYPVFTTLSNTSLISEEAIGMYDIINGQLKKEILLSARPADLEKREAQLTIVNDIKQGAFRYSAE